MRPSALRRYALPLLAVYLPPAAVLLVWGAGLTAWQWMICFAGGLLLWTLIEYGVHRFVFHAWGVLRLGGGGPAHSRHHETPSEPEFIPTPLSFSLPVAVVIFGLLRLALGKWEPAGVIMGGVIVGYLFYEVVHLQIHTKPEAGILVRRLRSYHYRHHFAEPDVAFGITTPLWDVVLRTLPVRRKADG